MSDDFKDCLIYECEQRSDEWFDLRRGNLTAFEKATRIVSAIRDGLISNLEIKY